MFSSEVHTLLGFCVVCVNNASAISNAWNQQYAGKYHRLLLDNINRMSRGKPYSNYVAILQSSGSGKSRMVREQSNLVFTLPFNLRAHSESKDMAYPPPDNEIRNYLDQQAANLYDGQTRHLHLLGHLFKTVSDELVVWYSQKQPSYVALAESWRVHVEKGQNRSRIYSAAVERCRADDLVLTLFMICICHSLFSPESLAKEAPSTRQDTR